MTSDAATALSVPTVPSVSIGARWWRWLRWPAIAVTCCLCASFVWQHELAFSASANSWLAALSGPAGSFHGLPGAALRALSKTLAIEELGQLAIYGQLFLAAAHLVLLVAVGRLMGLGDAAIALAPAMLLFGPGRDALSTVSAESLLSTLNLLLAVAICSLDRFPRAAALVLGGGLFAVSVAHPMGLVMLPALAVAAAMFPRPHGPAPLGAAYAARPIWLPWLAAVVLCAGLIAAVLPGHRLKLTWEATILLLRSTAPTPNVGGVADWPLVGPTIVALSQLPLPILLLSGFGAIQAVRKHGREPIAVVAALAASWLLVAAVVARPHAGPFAPVTAIASLLLLLAVWAARQWLVRLWSIGQRGQLAAIALAATAVVATLMDSTWAQRDDPRSAWSRAIGLAPDMTADRPARIDAADIALLRAHPETTAILPAHRDGNALARRLGKLRIVPSKTTFVRPFAAQLVLLHMPGNDPIQAAWRAQLTPMDCDTEGRSCLFRLKPKTH